MRVLGPSPTPFKWSFVWFTLFAVSIGMIVFLNQVLRGQEVFYESKVNQVLKETEKKGVWVFIPDQYIESYKEKGWVGRIEVKYKPL